MRDSPPSTRISCKPIFRRVRSSRPRALGRVPGQADFCCTAVLLPITWQERMMEEVERCQWATECSKVRQKLGSSPSGTILKMGIAGRGGEAACYGGSLGLFEFLWYLGGLDGVPTRTGGRFAGTSTIEPPVNLLGSAPGSVERARKQSGCKDVIWGISH